MLRNSLKYFRKSEIAVPYFSAKAQNVYTDYEQHRCEGYGQREQRIIFNKRFVHCVPLYRANPDRRYGAKRARRHRGANSPALVICLGKLARRGMVMGNYSLTAL
jgi:hypothetical protein